MFDVHRKKLIFFAFSKCTFAHWLFASRMISAGLGAFFYLRFIRSELLAVNAGSVENFTGTKRVSDVKVYAARLSRPREKDSRRRT